MLVMVFFFISFKFFYLLTPISSFFFFFFSSIRRHTIFSRDWSSDVCSSDLSSISLRMLLRPSDTPAVRACGSARWPPRATAATTPGPRRRGNRSGGATLPEGAAPEPAVDVGEGDLADDLAVLHHHGGEADAGELVHHLVQPVVEPNGHDVAAGEHGVAHRAEGLVAADPRRRLEREHADHPAEVVAHREGLVLVAAQEPVVGLGQRDPDRHYLRRRANGLGHSPPLQHPEELLALERPPGPLQHHRADQDDPQPRPEVVDRDQPQPPRSEE